MIQTNFFRQGFRPLLFRPDKSAWCGHLSFAHDLTFLLRPNNYVELGTYYGDSFFTFCQTVKLAKLKTTCYAVDTWQGDDFVGEYDNSLYGFVQEYSKKEGYISFAKILRMTFNEALEKFSNAEIDLLHIDGSHDYESVKEDFENWLPKMSKKGIVLFHDVAEKKEGFGVWKYWEELKSSYPTFTFNHSSGLGVLKVSDQYSPLDDWIFNISEDAKGTIRSYYEKQYESLMTQYNFEMKNKEISDYIDQLREAHACLAYSENNKKDLEAENKLLKEHMHQIKEKLHVCENELHKIHRSITWRIINKVMSILRKLKGSYK